jgi:hypothetical protein
MPAKDPLVYVMHIRDSSRRIVEYTVAVARKLDETF